MILFGLLLLLGLAAGAPTSSEDGTHPVKEIITEDWLSKENKKYNSKHDIVNIFVADKILNLVPILFFVEGEYKQDGSVDQKGLFALNIETGQATKLLENGVGFTASNDRKVFFAATDGIYVYNAQKNTAEKYGSITDNFISIAKAKNSDVIYALTAAKELYKITENGEKKEKVEDVKNAEQIMLDEKDNLYFYNSEKDVYVVTENGVSKVEGLPENLKKIIFLGAVPRKHAISAIVDDKMFMITENGRVEDAYVKIVIQPTAISFGSGLGFMFGYKKSIYQP